MSVVNDYFKKGVKSKFVESNIDKFTKVKKVISAAAVTLMCGINPAMAENNGSFTLRLTMQDGKIQFHQDGSQTRPSPFTRPRARPDDLLVGYEISDGYTLLQINSQQNSNVGITKFEVPTKEQCLDILVQSVKPWYLEGKKIDQIRSSNLSRGEDSLQQQFVKIVSDDNKLKEEILYYIDDNSTNRIGCFKT